MVVPGDDSTKKAKRRSILGIHQEVRLMRTNGTQEAATIHSPPQVLPTANFATLNTRLAKWTYCSGHGVGEMFGDASAEVNNIPINVNLVAKDALITNTCIIVAMQQHQLHEFDVV